MFPPDSTPEERLELRWAAAPFTGAELRVRRRRLGLDVRQLADVLGDFTGEGGTWRPIRHRTVQRWERGERPIPPIFEERLKRCEATFAATVQDVVSSVRNHEDPQVLRVNTDNRYQVAVASAALSVLQLEGLSFTVVESQPDGEVPASLPAPPPL
mgnify:CR=1 FL=1